MNLMQTTMITRAQTSNRTRKKTDKGPKTSDRQTDKRTRDKEPHESRQTSGRQTRGDQKRQEQMERGEATNEPARWDGPRGEAGRSE